MQEHIVVTRQRLRSQLIIGFSVGTITVMLAWVLWSIQAMADQDKVAASEASIVSSCRLPDVDGAMTVFVMEDGKMKCWRWK
jgi:hypothetical protein